MSTKPNLLFYTKTIPKNILLLDFLKKNNLDNFAKIICVDNNNVPSVKKITKYPTLIIPSINKIFVENEVYLFFVNLTTNGQQNESKDKEVNKSIERNDKEINQEVKDNQSKSSKQNTQESQYEVLGYIENEMSGLSDKYVFLNTDITPIHNYSLF